MEDYFFTKIAVFESKERILLLFRFDEGPYQFGLLALLCFNHYPVYSIWIFATVRLLLFQSGTVPGGCPDDLLL
jgi:hypothetical protein